MVLKLSKFPIGHIQLIDHRVTLLTHFSVDYHIDVLEELLALRPVVDDLHLLQIQHVPVLITHDGCRFTPLSQILFSILQSLLAEDGETLIKVLHGEDQARSTSQSLNLCASVPQSGQELLDKAKLLDHIEMGILVHGLVQGRCKLLLRVHIFLDLLLSACLIESRTQCTMLSIQHLCGYLDHIDIKQILKHLSLRSQHVNLAVKGEADRLRILSLGLVVEKQILIHFVLGCRIGGPWLRIPHIVLLTNSKVHIVHKVSLMKNSNGCLVLEDLANLSILLRVVGDASILVDPTYEHPSE